MIEYIYEDGHILIYQVDSGQAIRLPFTVNSVAIYIDCFNYHNPNFKTLLRQLIGKRVMIDGSEYVVVYHEEADQLCFMRDYKLYGAHFVNYELRIIK